ncbi:hypothetical protein OG342_32200 [Streptomyces bobili]|uniref:LamG domain-containing protein n=1 Tax=Streptomyces bobili TaxID=67280 RepID=UPI0022505CF8|nr:LamG-like jellyroll fold domain-containing protein [Streptomyces bobili]MCX5527468.1 hypothetical protein [Streptomyces bobili]
MDPLASESQKALAEAKASGDRVEVARERTETKSVFANPDGSTFTLEQSAVPVRVKAPEGGWQAPDATLTRRADGTVVPKAAAVAIEFSGGRADQPLVRIEKDGKSLALDWPTPLPEPELEQNSALYRDVLEGVDLRLTASVEGFRQVLVVKTPEAAARPELRRIEYALSTDRLRVAQQDNGSFQALDENGNWVFRAPRAQMWDSAGATGTTVASRLASSATDTDGAGRGVEPAAGDVVKPMDVSVDQDSLTVAPDAQMLASTAAENFPLYVDPTVTWNESERTLLRSDGYESYGWSNGDDNLGKGVGRCGTWNGYYCGPGYTQRLYFEFSPASLKGKRVLDATFRVTEPWAFQCSPRWVQLYRTNNISSATTWATRPTPLDLVGDRNVSAGRGSSCDPDSPAAPIEFNDDPTESYENLTPTVRSFAEGKFSRLTLMLKAKDETDASAWKRFRNDGVLAVSYVGLPAQPTNPLIASSCETDASDPAWISDTTPSMSAQVQTAAGGEGQATLRAYFYVQRKNADGTWSVVTEPVRPSSGYLGDNVKVTLDSPVTLAQNVLHRMAVFSRSYYNDGASHLQSNSTVTTKGWCYFQVDSTRPKPPLVTTSAGALYSVCPEEGDGCGVATGGPGQAGQFTFTRNSVDSNIVAFEYKLATDTKWAKVSATSSVTRSIRPVLSGVQVLSVRAVDSVGTGQAGEIKAIRFNVAEGQGASGRWNFDDGAPGSGVSTAADSGTAPGTRHGLTLREAGSGWSTFSRTGDAGRSLWLNDSTDSTRQTGYAESTGPVVNTTSSFTVSAWAYAKDDTAFRTLVSQTSSDNKGFSLYYSPGVGRWVFLFHWYENGVRKHMGSNADATPGLTLNAWTHVAGVYNGDDHTLSVFVNGKRQGDPVAVPEAGWPTTVDGNLQVGRAGTTYGNFNNYWKGRVDELAVFQGDLPDLEVAKEAKFLDSDGTGRAVELMAAWQPQGSTGTAALTDTLSDYPRTLQLNGGAAVDDGAIVLDGADDSVTTPGPVIDDRESFTVSTEVELNTAVLETKSVGYTAQVLGQRSADGSSWGLWYEKTGTEDYFDDNGELHQRSSGLWRFGRLDANGVFTAVDSNEVADSGQVRLTGVHDAQEGTIRLYLATTQNDVDTLYTAAIGAGEFAGGKGYVNGSWGHYLPGRISDIRIWVGAAADGDQVERLLGGPGTEAPDDTVG